MIQNNADTVNGNEYTWVIRKDNYGIKEIIIKLDQTKKITDNQRLSSSESNKVINIVLIAIGGISVAMEYWGINKSDNTKIIIKTIKGGIKNG